MDCNTAAGIADVHPSSTPVGHIVRDNAILDDRAAAAIDVYPTSTTIHREGWVQRRRDILADDTVADHGPAVADVERSASATAAGSGPSGVANQVTVFDSEAFDEGLDAFAMDQEKPSVDALRIAFDVDGRRVGAVGRFECDHLAEEADVAVAVAGVGTGRHENSVSVG